MKQNYRSPFFPEEIGRRLWEWGCSNKFPLELHVLVFVSPKLGSNRIKPGAPHQSRRQRQAPHGGLQLVHRRRDTLDALRHQRLDLDLELPPALLLVVRLAGGEELLGPGSCFTRGVRERSTGMPGATKHGRHLETKDRLQCNLVFEKKLLTLNETP